MIEIGIDFRNPTGLGLYTDYKLCTIQSWLQTYWLVIKCITHKHNKTDKTIKIKGFKLINLFYISFMYKYILTERFLKSLTVGNVCVFLCEYVFRLAKEGYGYIISKNFILSFKTD